MEYVHQELELSTTQLEPFSVPNIKTTYVSYLEQKFHPNSLSGDNQLVYQITIKSDSKRWIKLSDITLYMETSIQEKKDGLIKDFTNLGGNSLTYQTLYPYLIFDSIGIEFNDKLISQNNEYPIRSFLKTILSYDMPNIYTNLELSSLYMGNEDDGWYDTAPLRSPAISSPSVNAVTLTAHDTKFKTLYDLFTTSNKTKRWTITPLYCDIIDTYKLIPPGITVKLTFTRNKELSSIIHTPNPTTYAATLPDMHLNIHQIYIKVPMLELNEEINTKYKEAIKQNIPIYIPFTRNNIRVLDLDLVKTQYFYNITSGKLPRSVIIFIYDPTRKTSRNKNTLFFEKSGIKEITLDIPGSTDATRKVEMDWTNNTWQFAYYHYLNNIGYSHNNEHNLISKSRFENGMTIFPFDLTPDRYNYYYYYYYYFNSKYY